MKSRILVAAAVLVLLAIAAIVLPVQEWLQAALSWTDAHREVAWVLFVVLYVVATVALLPGLILTVAAGAIFGLTVGVVLVSIGSVLGATAAFSVGRTLAREWISRKIEMWPKFRALDRALGARGFTIVLLTRLSPIFPFNLLNYAYGVTAVRLRDYIFGSWIGMLPGTVLYVYAGSAAATLAQALAGDVDTGRAGQALLWLGLGATVAVTILVTRVARRQLERQLA